jgi:hypothetical protein
VQVDADQGDQGHGEEVHPVQQQEQAHRAQVVPVLGGQAPGQLTRGLQMGIDRGVPGDGARDLEGRRAQQPDALPDLPVDRDHDLRRQQDVVPDPGLRRVGDRVAEEAVRADRGPGHLERRAGGRRS